MKAFAPAAERNRMAIADVLRTCLPAEGRVLEIASGTGLHVVCFAESFPGLQWQPSDIEPRALASVEAWRQESGLRNIDAAIELDVTWDDWPIGSADIHGIICINMLHIAPWRAAEGLTRGAGRLLPAGGLLYLYGPYVVPGRPTATSNLAFDESLRRSNGEWGLRSVADVEALAADHGFSLRDTRDMPANNISLIFTKEEP